MTKYLSTEEARDLGVLQELNRLLLHPRGLALEGTIRKPDEDGATEIFTLVFYERGLDALRSLVVAARTAHALKPEYLDDLQEMIDRAAANPSAGVFRFQDHRDDPEGVYFGEDAVAKSTDGETVTYQVDRMAKADAFDALLTPEKETTRREKLGYVVQPLGDDQ